jgi:predicted MFS family arabinose efflux permease
VLIARYGDRHAGLNLLVAVPFLTLVIPPLVFSTNFPVVIAGIVCWGVVMGIQETIMRSAVADITSLKKRGTGYGIFNAAYGLAVFLGSMLLGYLYDRSAAHVTAAVTIIELGACVTFYFLRKEIRLVRAASNG